MSSAFMIGAWMILVANRLATALTRAIYARAGSSSAATGPCFSDEAKFSK
jgi:hypothetical protein